MTKTLEQLTRAARYWGAEAEANHEGWAASETAANLAAHAGLGLDGWEEFPEDWRKAMREAFREGVKAERLAVTRLSDRFFRPLEVRFFEEADGAGGEAPLSICCWCHSE